MTVPAIAVSTPVGPAGAPLLVLGCSLGTSSLLWEESTRVLERRFRVSCWDLPGHGASPASAADFSIGELADAVAASYAEEFAYAGVSIGGAVGLELALRHPDRVRAVVTLCSGARFLDPATWQERARVVRSSGTGALIVPSAQRWFAPGTMERSPDVAGRLLHSLRDADDESYARCCDALADFDVRSRLREVARPVTAVYGVLDAVTPEASSREIVDGVPGARLVGLDGAAHLAPVDEPHESAAAVIDALATMGVEGATDGNT
jgi:3-oxoadipate enol-lactonase